MIFCGHAVVSSLKLNTMPYHAVGHVNPTHRYPFTILERGLFFRLYLSTLRSSGYVFTLCVVSFPSLPLLLALSCHSSHSQHHHELYYKLRFQMLSLEPGEIISSLYLIFQESYFFSYFL